ncbi:MAG: tagaturonate epimerase family protein, partial [Verrucomicrobiales bacterium]
MRTVPKFTFGVGDRFGQSATSQLSAFVRARQAGIELVPIWNKSNREHLIVGSEPAATRAAADQAVAELGWDGEYLLDADHINLDTVDRYVPHCDFFTLDVADVIGEAADATTLESFVERHPELIGQFGITREDVEATARQFLAATHSAGEIYRHILERKGGI